MTRMTIWDPTGKDRFSDPFKFSIFSFSATTNLRDITLTTEIMISSATLEISPTSRGTPRSILVRDMMKDITTDRGNILNSSDETEWMLVSCQPTWHSLVIVFFCPESSEMRWRISAYFVIYYFLLLNLHLISFSLVLFGAGPGFHHKTVNWASNL